MKGGSCGKLPFRYQPGRPASAQSPPKHKAALLPTQPQYSVNFTYIGSFSQNVG